MAENRTQFSSISWSSTKDAIKFYFEPIGIVASWLHNLITRKEVREYSAESLHKSIWAGDYDVFKSNVSDRLHVIERDMERILKIRMEVERELLKLKAESSRSSNVEKGSYIVVSGGERERIRHAVETLVEKADAAILGSITKPGSERIDLLLAYQHSRDELLQLVSPSLPRRHMRVIFLSDSELEATKKATETTTSEAATEALENAVRALRTFGKGLVLPESEKRSR